MPREPETPPESALAPLDAPFTPALSSEPPLEPIAALEGLGEPTAPPEGLEPPRKRRGRPPKGTGPSQTPDAIRRRAARARQRGEPEPEPEPTGPTPEDMAATASALALGFQTVAALVAARRGAHWALTPGEAHQLGTAWAEAAKPWLARVGPAVPWLTAALVTAGVAAPRLMQDAARQGSPVSVPAVTAASAEEVAPASPPSDGPTETAAPDLPPAPLAPGAGGGPIRAPKARK